MPRVHCNWTNIISVCHRQQILFYKSAVQPIIPSNIVNQSARKLANALEFIHLDKQEGLGIIYPVNSANKETFEKNLFIIITEGH